MHQVARALLAWAALAGLMLSWLIYSRLGSGSPCEYPADCVEWWLPQSYDRIQVSWLLAVLPTWTALALLWRRFHLGSELATIGAAGLATTVSVAITPMAIGSSRSSGLFEFYADSYLWLRMGLNGMDALAVVTAVGSMLLAWRALQVGTSSAGSAVCGREALLWWPVGSAIPLAVVAAAIAAEAGTRLGLAERTAGAIATLVLVLEVALLALAAYRRSLVRVTSASLMVLGTHLLVILVSVRYAYNEDWRMLSVDIAVLVTALLLPLLPAWIVARVQGPERDRVRLPVT